MDLNKDAHLKDDGDTTTVFFNSDEAKSIAREMFGNRLSNKGDVLYIDISITSKPHIIAWLISHNLSSETV